MRNYSHLAQVPWAALMLVTTLNAIVLSSTGPVECVAMEFKVLFVSLIVLGIFSRTGASEKCPLVIYYYYSFGKYSMLLLKNEACTPF